MTENLPRPQTPEEKLKADWDRLGQTLAKAMTEFGESMQKLADDLREASGGPKVVRSERVDKDHHENIGPGLCACGARAELGESTRRWWDRHLVEKGVRP